MSNKVYSFLLLSLFLKCFNLNQSLHAKTIDSINLGVRFNNLVENRGVILYNDYQLIPFVTVNMFDNRVEFLTSSLGFRDFIYEDKLRVRTRFQIIQDNPVFPVNKNIENKKYDRDITFEWLNRLEYFWGGYEDNYIAESSLGWIKDIKAHSGDYFEFISKIKITEFRIPGISFLGIDQFRYEPNLFLSIGYGDERHNTFYYGPEKYFNQQQKSSLNNYSVGFVVNLPGSADRNNAFMTLRYFEILGQDNKNGLFTEGNTNGILFVVNYVF